MPIYNVARYLDESIGSLINQTIDFKSIQIILVNDGSTDNAEEICLKYKKMYEENIIYIKIEHGGVSKARNIGLKYANGTYINFLDADDKWDYKAFKNILLFFENNKDIDLVAGRIKFFEAEENYHPLDYKFYKTRIVNLNQEYNCIQLSASSSFFKKSLIEGKYFDEKVYYCEDSRFINSLLLFKPIMGLIREAIYFYRRRADFSSAIQNQKEDLNFYFGTLKYVSNYLFKSSIGLYNQILPFIQFLISYDIFFRIQSQAFKFLNKNNLRKYSNMIEELLEKIDDKYILEQKILSNKYKFLALSKKFHTNLSDNITIQNNNIMYSKYIMINLKKKKDIIEWKFLNIKNDTLYLEAIDNLWIPLENNCYFCKVGNKTFFPKYFENKNYDFFAMDGLIKKGRTITFQISLDSINTPQIINFYISFMNQSSEIFPSLGLFSHIPPLNNGYYISENYIIKYFENRLILFQYSQKLEIEFEKLYCHELFKAQKDRIIRLRKQMKYKKKIKRNKHYEIWILNDRYNSARDNGEYFFRYLKRKNPNGIKAYFVISKNCPDFKRLKPLGNIVDINSNKYLKLFLDSDKIISSVPYYWVDNPFKQDQKYIRDILHYDFVFLQNGITKDDLSKSLNRFNKNYNLIITSNKREYKSILNPKYEYNEKNVILTGMPRYDNLYRLKNTVSKQNKIIIMPTWRMNIKGTKNLKTYESIHSNKFVFTEFFEYYNALINDKNLLLIMEKYNYTGELCLHPFFESQWIDFNQNKIFSIKERCDFQKLLLEASLLITDYSSTFFDFGYLKKPIIYAHFDYEIYRSSHYHQGYFDYKKDGFGPICRDIKCTIDETIFEIENSCILRKKYLKRIEKFFTFSDEKNSERIFMEIIKNKNLIIENENNPNYIFLCFIIFSAFYKVKKHFL